MPSRSPAAHFLGLELAVDQLRASVVDEQLDLVGVACVDFDADLPEYQTQGGIFTTPGDAYTTPVEMWVHALDLLLERLRTNFDLSKIKSISGSAQHALVWWKSAPAPPFVRLSAHYPLLAQLRAAAPDGSGTPFALPHTPVAQDTSTLAHALALEAALGGPDAAAARLGTPAHASLAAAQALRVREAQPEVWARSGRVTLASTMLCSLFLGAWAPTGESEACATGMWSHTLRAWDEGVLEVVCGGVEEVGRLRAMLGEVDTSGGGRRVGNIASYFVERYGFSADTLLAPFTSDYLATYLSLCPSPTDAVLSFGPMDTLMTAAPHYLPSRLYALAPHPAQEPGEKKRYVAMLVSRNGDVPRALVRDMYTKSWSAFDRLIAIVPPGGSIGLDDKLFAFWVLQGEAFPFAHVKGIFRFETGVKVNEFRDLRANPRCLLESQLLSFRVRYARMRASNLFFPANRSSTATPSQSLGTGGILNPGGGLGLTFDPYSTAPLPRRIVATGAAANFPSIVGLLGDVFAAPVYVPASQLESAHAPAPTPYGAAHRNAPAPGCTSRAALGGAYVARWVWGRDRASGGAGAGVGVGVAFEDEVRRLLARRWNAAALVRKQGASGSGPGTPSPAPYLQHQRSGLGNTVLMEEEEEEEEGAGDGYGGAAGAAARLSNGTPGLASASTPPARIRTTTGSSLASSATGQTPSTAFTSPDISIGPGGLSGLGGYGAGGASLSAGIGLGVGAVGGLNNGISGELTPTTPGAGATTPTAATAPASGVTPLTPVGALPTGDAEAQLGWAKVAEPDADAFMAYAALVPEFVRLEGLLVKSLV